MCGNAPRLETDFLFISGGNFPRRGTAINRAYYALGDIVFASKEDSMIRTVFAVGLAALVLAAVSGLSQAAPIAPLPAGVASDAASSHVTPVWCGWRCRHWHRWCRWHRC
jgi:hypothetical protein